MPKHDLVTTRDTAIGAVDDAKQLVEKLSEHHYRELPREFSKAVITHPNWVYAIEGKPRLELLGFPITSERSTELQPASR